ncbi:hypothetical protein [Bartonella sp. OT172YNZD]|uniref:hypothetical protein n=1 Tax=Bartonella sp. OT172YNZD TaxID=3243572 RepID=UPI0035CF1EF1
MTVLSQVEALFIQTMVTHNSDINEASDLQGIMLRNTDSPTLTSEEQEIVQWIFKITQKNAVKNKSIQR